jgi:hypothetical protein
MDGMNTADQHGIGRSAGAGRPVNPSANGLNTKLDVQHFRVLAQTKPRTKTGQVRQVWPDIKIALPAGHRLKDIRTRLNEIGIEIGYARLSDYVGHLKRREAVPALARVTSETPRSAVRQAQAPASHRNARTGTGSGPLANLMEHERRQGLFGFNPEPDVRKLI